MGKNFWKWNFPWKNIGLENVSITILHPFKSSLKSNDATFRFWKLAGLQKQGRLCIASDGGFLLCSSPCLCALFPHPWPFCPLPQPEVGMWQARKWEIGDAASLRHGKFHDQILDELMCVMGNSPKALAGDSLFLMAQRLKGPAVLAVHTEGPIICSSVPVVSS